MLTCLSIVPEVLAAIIAKTSLRSHRVTCCIQCLAPLVMSPHIEAIVIVILSPDLTQGQARKKLHIDTYTVMTQCITTQKQVGGGWSHKDNRGATHCFEGSAYTSAGGIRVQFPHPACAPVPCFTDSTATADSTAQKPHVYVGALPLLTQRAKRELRWRPWARSRAANRAPPPPSSPRGAGR